MLVCCATGDMCDWRRLTRCPAGEYRTAATTSRPLNTRTFMALRTHLQRAQTLALDPVQPISAALRHLVALGAVPELAEVRVWALNELKGYVGTPGESLPAYRKLRSPLRGTLFDGRNRATFVEVELELPEGLDEETRCYLESLVKFVPLVQPVGELEELLSQTRGLGMHQHSLPVSVLPLVRSRQFNLQCVEAYLPVLPAPLASALDQIRTAVVEFVSVALASLPDASGGVDSDDSHEAKAVVHNVFQNCQIGATSTNGVRASHSSIGAGFGSSQNLGVVAAQYTHSDAVTTRSLLDELRGLAGALAQQASDTDSLFGRLTQAIAEFESRAGQHGIELFGTLEDVRAMLDPIWEKHMNEAFQTTGQRWLEQGGKKMLSALPSIAKLLV